MRIGRVGGVAAFLAVTATLTATLGACTRVVDGTALPADGTAGPRAQTDLESAGLSWRDLPPGWTASRAPLRDSGGMELFRACLGAPAADPANRIEVALSPAFVDDSGATLGSAVSRYRSAEQIEGDTALFADVRAPGCFGQAVADSLQGWETQGLAVGVPRTTVVADPSGPPTNVMAVATVELPMTTAAGDRWDYLLQYFFLAGRTTEAVVAVTGIGELPPGTVVGQVVEAVAERVAVR